MARSSGGSGLGQVGNRVGSELGATLSFRTALCRSGRCLPNRESAFCRWGRGPPCPPAAGLQVRSWPLGRTTNNCCAGAKFLRYLLCKCIPVDLSHIALPPLSEPQSLGDKAVEKVAFGKQSVLLKPLTRQHEAGESHPRPLRELRGGGPVLNVPRHTSFHDCTNQAHERPEYVKFHCSHAIVNCLSQDGQCPCRSHHGVVLLDELYHLFQKADLRCWRGARC